MREFVRITVPLSHDEFMALRHAADSDYRQPREQARYLIRRALLGNGRPSTKSNTNTEAGKQTSVGVVETAR